MSESPLSEVVRDRRINSILEAIRKAVRHGQPLVIEPRDVNYIRRSFTHGIMVGERQLHELAWRILKGIAPNVQMNVTLITWGRCDKIEHKGIVTHEVDLQSYGEDFLATSDSALAALNRPECPLCKMKCSTIASFIRHEPAGVPVEGFSFLQTRIKSTSNLCYKIADMVFDIDYMFQRDKIFNQFSQTVADIYGLKWIVTDHSNLAPAVSFLEQLPGAEVVEKKDYTGTHRKKSGYEAIKLVVKQNRQLFEVQIQTKTMWESEQSNRLTRHHTYKEYQMLNRRKLGREYISLYQALTQLLQAPDENVSSIDYIEIGKIGKGMDDEF